jgi:putative ABC transport system substrate-binding protein
MRVRRRDFITLLGGAAAWPLSGLAQQPERMRRVGILMGYVEKDPEFQVRLDAIIQGLGQAGWIEGRNIRLDVRWTNVDVGRTQVLAKELIALQPDVVVAATTLPTAALRQQTRTLPIVFASVADPVGEGFVASLARPGGNITGFISEEASLVGKELELLKEIAPRLTKVAIMFNPDTAPGGGAYYLGSFDAAAKSLGVEPILTRVKSDSDIEAIAASIGRERGGILAMTDAFTTTHRRTLMLSAARENVPAIINNQAFPREGGLMSYGPNFLDIFRRIAPYVDRILRGAKPADLPVQVPTRFDLVINLRTAKALGLEVPFLMQQRADELIE